MSPFDFHLLRPEWLWLLLPLAIMLWRLLRADADGNAWQGLVDAHLLPRLLVDGGGQTRGLPLGLLAIGWLLGTVALAGPTWARLPTPVYQAQQYRVIALDLSPSMNATDIAPSRLAHARYEVLDLLRKAGDGQTAMLAYGAEPFVVSPLTADAATIAAQVPSLTTGLLPVQGARRTDLVLAQAGELLRQAGAPDGEVILVTDGLDHPAAADAAARKLHAQGYRVSVLGVGTRKGAPVPLRKGGFLKNENGAILMPKLDNGALRALASAGGGRYVIAAADDRDIEALVPSPPSLTQAAKKQDAQSEQWREEGPWLLLILLPLAALGFRRGWLSPLLLVVCLLPVPDAHAFTWNDLWLRPDQQAAQQLEAGKPAEAAKLFRQPNWRAAAQYRAGDYAQALQSLKTQTGADAAYNRGNALARLGRLEDAVAAYKRALEANPDDADARHNRDLVQALLDRQRAQQPQQSSGQQNQQGQQGQQKQQDGQQGGSPDQPQAGHEGRDDQRGQQAAEKNRQDQPGTNAPHAQQQQPSPQAEKPGEQPGAQAAGEQPEPISRQDAQAGREREKPPVGQGADQAPAASQSAAAGDEARPSSEPGLADLLGGDRSAAAQGGTPPGDLHGEDRQAMEQMLRRVEDDPAGLLRQRFLLQHLRRNGQLP